MQRTIKIKLDENKNLIKTIKMFSNIVKLINEIAVLNQTRNKTKLHNLSYNLIRKKYPTFPSGLIQTARDIVCEQLKREKKFKLFNFKEYTAIRYDKRNIRINFEHNLISISSIKGRLKFNYKDTSLSLKYKNWKTKSATLKYKNKQLFLNIVVEMETPEVKLDKIKETDFIGLDRGIKNIVVASNNQFFTSKKLKKIKGKYKYLKKVLQKKGTKSAIRKLKLISGKEKRFVSDTNHCLSKELANSDFKVFVIEDLKKIRNSNKGKKFNAKLGNWSFKQFETYLQYKLENVGKLLIKVNPKYTSQKCVKCDYIKRTNRNGNIFKCKNCGYETHSDLNASKNIVKLGISEYNRLYVNQPIVGLNEITSVIDNTYKPTISMVGN
jgi:putative transposase